MKKSCGGEVNATVAGVRCWRLLVGSSHAGGFDKTAVSLVTGGACSRYYRSDRAALFRDAQLAPIRGRPDKRRGKQSPPIFILVGRPRSTGLHLSGRNLRKFVKLATWNARTLLDRDEVQRMERRSAVVAKELGKIGVDIAALQETRLESSGVIKEKEFSIFWSGVEAGERRHAESP